MRLKDLQNHLHVLYFFYNTCNVLQYSIVQFDFKKLNKMNALHVLKLKFILDDI